MQRSNIWGIQVYPLTNFRDQFNALSKSSQQTIESLLRDLVQMTDPEDHATSRDCPGIQGFNHAVKYVIDNYVTLIVALDRIDLNDYHDHMITLFSCSE